MNVFLELRYQVYFFLWKFRRERNRNFMIFLNQILNQIKSYSMSPSHWADGKFNLIIMGTLKSRNLMWCPKVGNQEKGPGFNSTRVTLDFSTVHPTRPVGRWLHLCHAWTGLCAEVGRHRPGVLPFYMHHMTISLWSSTFSLHNCWSWRISPWFPNTWTAPFFLIVARTCLCPNIILSQS